MGDRITKEMLWRSMSFSIFSHIFIQKWVKSVFNHTHIFWWQVTNENSCSGTTLQLYNPSNWFQPEFGTGITIIIKNPNIQGHYTQNHITVMIKNPSGHTWSYNMSVQCITCDHKTTNFFEIRFPHNEISLHILIISLEIAKSTNTSFEQQKHAGL